MNNSSNLNLKKLHPVLRWVLFVTGFISIALALIGIFLPVLPTVPFLLLALGCFARSSERFYTWLLEHAHLGQLIRPYIQGEGVPQATKIKAIALIWISITISVLFLLETLWVRVLLLVIASSVTAYLWYLPTAKTGDDN